MAETLTKVDLVILDELGYLPFSSSGGALLFHLLSKLYERTSVIITTNLSFSEWAQVFRESPVCRAISRIGILSRNASPLGSMLGMRLPGSERRMTPKIPCRSLQISLNKNVRAMCSHGSILSDNLWGYRVSSQ